MKKMVRTAIACAFTVSAFLTFVFYPCFEVARAWDLDWRHRTIDGEPTIDMGPSKQEQEKQDRADRAQREKADAQEKAAKDASTAAAYAQSRRERIAKSKRRAKAAGRKKPYYSWQLQHR